MPHLGIIASRAQNRPFFVPGGILQGAKTPHFAPGNPIFTPPGANQGPSAPGKRDSPVGAGE